MSLRTLLDPVTPVPAALERDITGLALDSRRVQSGNLFIALAGALADGRRHIGEAVAAGAAAVVADVSDGFVPSDVAVPVFGVRNLRAALGSVASRFYGAPSRNLVVLGVTGTNGKTTCTQLLAQALDRTAGAGRCGVIGTLGTGFPDALDESAHTTPDAVSVQRLLRTYLDAGASHVAMEVSSHALDQGRVNDVAFACAVFTNLTRDHLDYHGDMESYGAAKARLFAWPGLKYAAINRDDEFGRRMLDSLDARVARLSYGLNGGEVSARAVRPGASGIALDVTTPQGSAQIEAPLFGRFNASNLLAALATLLLLELSLAEAVARLHRVRPVPGRAECFGGGSGQPLAIVDYAHTPDALEKILGSLREHTHGKIICVFGCGGDRDRGKRPMMGAIAERLADLVIVTDDNPRTEAPQQIIDDIRTGMRRAPLVIRDRARAIAEALAAAEAGDIVLVAGKGHENYQQVGMQRLPYSDRDTVRKYFGEAA